MTIYPKGTRIIWDKRSTPRKGAQSGTLARDWEEHTVAYVLWDGEDCEQQELPECVEPLEQQTSKSLRDAWMEVVR